MEFKLKMPAKSLFKDCKSFQEKQQKLIGYGIWLSSKLKRSLITSDFTVPDRVHSTTIIVYFKSIKNYFNTFGKIDFKLLMPEIALFRGYNSQQEKCQRLIDYGNWLCKELGKPLVSSDFEVMGRISSVTIITYFDGSMTNYFNSCDFPSTQRKPNMTDSEFKEFLKTIKLETEKGCWVTDRYKTSYPDGRIRIGYKKKNQYLYRVSYALFNGSISDELIVMHKCDNPPCFNPKHLAVGTKQDNSRDAANKGRIVSASKRRKHHKITDPYDYKSLFNFVKQHIKITKKDEWIFASAPSEVYPSIQIKKRRYRLHRLLLANKLGKTYDEVRVACHRLPDGSQPSKRDVNPDHLFEGTHSGNTLDTTKYHKGYKLSNQLAKKIREAAKKYDFSERGSKRRFDREWAAKLSVSEMAIASVRIGKTWKEKINT